MEKITGSVRFRHEKQRYTVRFEILEDGVIVLDESGGFSNAVYKKAHLKVVDQYLVTKTNDKKELKEKGSEKTIDADLRKMQLELEKLREENERLRQRRGGRPSIGETRKVSLTLPKHIWSDIDAAVRLGNVKQGFVLRDMIVQAHMSDFEFWKGLRGSEDE